MPTYITERGQKRRLELTQTRAASIPADPSSNDQVFPTLVQFSRARGWITFKFPFPPVNIQYQNLVPEWVEIDRPGFVPIVGVRKYNLMRLQFEFLIAAPWDGIKFSVDEELSLIREMANGTNPIYFNDMDAFTSDAMSLPGSQRTSGSGMFFRITDFTVQSMRRNPANEITAAQCSIALQEDYSLNITAVTMPAIEYPTILKPRIKAPSTAPTGFERCTISNSTYSNCIRIYNPRTGQTELVPEDWLGNIL